MSSVLQGPIREGGQIYSPRSIGMSQATRKAAESSSSWIVADDPSKELMSTARSLISNQNQRLFDNVRFMSLVANRDFLSRHTSGVKVSAMPRMADNQLAKQVDTTVGKLIQANSRVTMLTDSGDFSLWNKARKMESALAGEWTRMGLYRELQKVCKDGITCGTGYLKLWERDDGKAIECQRVFPNEIFVDDMETAYGACLKMYQIRYVSKDALMAMAPDKASIINSANHAPPPSFPWTQYASQMIEVVEAWALPVGDRPGRHTIAVDSGCLVDEEYDETDFPFVVFRPCDAPLGFYGQGWVEQTMAAQILLNKMLNVMEQSAHYGAVPFWVVAEGSGINQKHLDTTVGHIIETSGGDPKWVTNAPFHEAAPQYCAMLRQVIADFFGNNSMDTGGDVPINRIDSKKALREYQDMGASRITTLLERWTEDVFVDCARRTLALAKRVARANGGYPVLVKDTFKKAVQLNWRDLDLDGDAYLLTPAPANLLSTKPAGRIDDIKELLQSGLITQKQAQRAMMGPDDINALIGEATATEADLDWLIEQFVEEGKYHSPESTQDIARGVVRISDAKLQYRTRGLPEERLELFDQWLEEAQDVLQDMQAQNAPVAPPMAPDGAQAAPGGGAAAPLGASTDGGIPSIPAGNPSTGAIPA